MRTRRWAVSTAAALVVGLAPLVPTAPAASADPPAPATDWQLVWSDEFAGSSLDTSIWSIGTANQNWHGGWNTSEAVSVGSNVMTIDTWTDTGPSDPNRPAAKPPATAVPTPNPHNTAVVQAGSNRDSEAALNKLLGTYGVWEARIKFDDAPGMRSSWWLYTRDINRADSEPLGDTAAAGTEIDIIEHFADPADPAVGNRYGSTLHWDGYQGGHQTAHTAGGNWITDHPTSTPLQGNFHDYSVEWTPLEYIFRIDGFETGRLSRAISHRSLFPILSTELVDMPPGVNYGAKGAAGSRVTVDYVRLYQKPIATGTGTVPGTWTETTQQDTPRAIPLTVRHIDTVPARPTTVSVTSLNQALVKPSGIAVTGSSADRTLVVYPEAGQTGSAVLQITVSTPGLANVTKNITLNVTGAAPSTPTAWNAIPQQEAPWGSAKAIPFTVPASSPAPTATSNTPYLVPNSSIAIVGTGTRRALVVTPRPTRTGVADIVVSYNGQSQAFKFKVHAGTLINGDLEQGTIGWTFNAGATRYPPTGPGAFISATTGTATQGILGLEPNTTYVVGGTGLMSGAGSSPLTVSGFGGTSVTTTFSTTTAQTRYVTFTTGETNTTATITVGDNDADQLLLDEVYLYRAPMITSIADRSTARNTSAVVDFTVGRVGEPFPSSQLTVESSNTAVVPSAVTPGTDPGIKVDATVDANDPFQHRVTLIPNANVTGDTTISVKARDPYGHEAVRQFRVVFNAGDFNPVFDSGPVPDPLSGWQRAGPVWTAEENSNTLIRLGSGAYAQRQVTGLTPGTTYELAGRLQAWKPGNTDALWLGIKDHGGSPLAASVNGGGGWAPASVRFVANASGNATVFLSNTSTAGTNDDVQADMLTLLPVTGAPAAPFASPGQPPNRIRERSTIENVAAVVPFLVGASDTIGTPIVDNTTLFPSGSLVLSGSGANRMLRATPAANKTGTATVTLPVTAGGTTTSHQFKLVVGAGTFRDGGFEEPTAKPSWSNPLANIALIANSPRAHVAQLEPNGNLSRTVTLNRGTTYRLDDMTRYDTAGGSSTAWIRVMDGSTQLALTTHPAGTTAWTAHPLTFTTPAGSGTINVTVQFINWNPGAKLWVDDVAVVRQ